MNIILISLISTLVINAGPHQTMRAAQLYPLYLIPGVGQQHLSTV